MRKLRYNIEIRDKDGKLYENSLGHKLANYFHFEERECDENLIHLVCQGMTRNYEAVCKEGSKINITVSYKDSISGTYTTLYSFYGAENRFIKH